MMNSPNAPLSWLVASLRTFLSVESEYVKMLEVDLPSVNESCNSVSFLKFRDLAAYLRNDPRVVVSQP